MMKLKASSILSVITALLVTFLAASAFALSYDALRSLSAEHGYPGWRSYLWPLTLDAVMIVAGLAVIRCNVVRERNLLPWAMVTMFTTASVIYNIIHAPADWLARSIASLPPIVVFLSLELLSGQLRSAVLSSDKAFRVAERKRSEEVHTEAQTGFPMPIEQAREQRKTGKERAINVMLNFFSENPNASHVEAAVACDRSRSWVSNQLRALEQEGVIERNGEGVEVITIGEQST